MTEPSDYCSIREAAETLGVSRDTILRMVARHDLESARIGGHTVILRRTVELRALQREQESAR